MFHRTLYGAAVTAAPRFTPFSRNCTLATPTLSVAVATTATVPDTVDPLAGVEIATFGKVVSALLTVTATSWETVALPALSRATADSLWVLFATEDVFQTTL